METQELDNVRRHAPAPPSIQLIPPLLYVLFAAPTTLSDPIALQFVSRTARQAMEITLAESVWLLVTFSPTRLAFSTLPRLTGYVWPYALLPIIARTSQELARSCVP